MTTLIDETEHLNANLNWGIIATQDYDILKKCIGIKPSKPKSKQDEK